MGGAEGEGLEVRRGREGEGQEGKRGEVGGAEEEGGVIHTILTTWHQSMTSYPLYTQCTSPSSPLPHTSTHKGTTHSPSDVALAEVLM